MLRSIPSVLRLALSAAILVLGSGLAVQVHAGTQDFLLVNETGVEIYSLYISETGNAEWEEDVLGKNVLPDGERLEIEFDGRSACLWDIMVTDDEDNTVEWTAINLCESSVVVLRCDEEECWAEYE